MSHNCHYFQIVIDNLNQIKIKGEEWHYWYREQSFLTHGYFLPSAMDKQVITVGLGVTILLSGQISALTGARANSALYSYISAYVITYRSIAVIFF